MSALAVVARIPVELGFGVHLNMRVSRVEKRDSPFTRRNSVNVLRGLTANIILERRSTGRFRKLLGVIARKPPVCRQGGDM
jgi:hypothetical protein